MIKLFSSVQYSNRIGFKVNKTENKKELDLIIYDVKKMKD